MYVGAIEAGGTKFVCALFEVNDPSRRPELCHRASIPTTEPEPTMDACTDFFRSAGKKLDGFGIASFGPIDCNPASPMWGRITTTPKERWRNTDIAGFFSRRLGLPPAFDTDVNGAALAEGLWGNGLGLTDFAYITIGTGIGGGIIAGSRILHGAMHPEIGHFKPQKMKGDSFAGLCPYHGDCLEGLASGPAIEARWGIRGENMPDSHPAWDMEAGYLAKACTTLAMVVSSQRVILGGSVGLRPALLQKVKKAVRVEVSDYLSWLESDEAIDAFVMPPALGNNAGIYGAVALALRSSLTA